MNFFDRQIIGGVGEGIRREWGLSDTALGLLGTVFTLLYAVVGLPLGRLSDTKERRKILAGGVFLWSLLTAVSGVARSFRAADRRAARRRRRRSDLLAGVHVAHRRLLSHRRARARDRDLDARPAARARPGQRRRRLDPAELGLAQRLLHRRRPRHLLRGGRARDARAQTGHGRNARRRRAAAAPATRTGSCCRFRRCCG